MDHKVTFKRKTGFVGGIESDLPQFNIFVDGVYVGYCSTKPNGGINIVGRVVDEVAEAIRVAVAEHWRQPEEETQSVNQLPAVGDVEDDDLDDIEVPDTVADEEVSDEE